MTERPESSHPRIAESIAKRRSNQNFPRIAATSDPSWPVALERLATATQGVITKRIDLVMLESSELVSTMIVRSALIGFGVLLALAAWSSGTAAVILYLMPAAGIMLQLIVYAGSTATLGVAVLAYAVRTPAAPPAVEAAADDEHAWTQKPDPNQEGSNHGA